MVKPRRIAVLGAGIMGSATALFAARDGAEVVLYDAAVEPFTGASRWNEGKIHLGFLYAGDPSLRTTQRILPGGLAFRPLVEELIGGQLEGITETEDLVLMHRDSVVSLDSARNYFEALGDLIRSDPAAPDYLVDVSNARVRELAPSELEAVADPEYVTGGFTVPERSVSTRWVADRFVAALLAEPGIELKTSTRVRGVRSDDPSLRGRLVVITDSGEDGSFDHVVNALWEGRPRIDSTVGIPPDDEWSYRYRLALFIRTGRQVDVPSAVICTGPFGDIKNYNGRDFYVSWYPAGLLAVGTDLDPPPVPLPDPTERDGIIREVFAQLGQIIPSVGDISEHAEEVRLEGGWVFAVGSGDLGDANSTLHRRDRIGIKRTGSYFSVDTGKYSVAPWLARRVTDAISGE